MPERFEGIPLFTRPHRDYDGLVKIFTPEFGTKMFFVKGMQRPSNRLKPQLQPLTINQYIGTINGTGLSFIQEANTLAGNYSLRSELKKQAYATYISQLVDASLEDNVPQIQVYRTLKQALKLIEQDIEASVVSIYMELYLLPFFGIYFNWQACTVCRGQEGPFDISIRHQGILCAKHFGQDPYRLHQSYKTTHLAILLANASLDQIHQVDLAPQTIEDLQELTDLIYREYVGIRLRSKSFIQQMKSDHSLTASLIQARNKHNQNNEQESDGSHDN
ncbi:DNA repair protein RecO [Hutsoniella sourekii]